MTALLATAAFAAGPGFPAQAVNAVAVRRPADQTGMAVGRGLFAHAGGILVIVICPPLVGVALALIEHLGLNRIAAEMRFHTEKRRAGDGNGDRAAAEFAGTGGLPRSQRNRIGAGSGLNGIGVVRPPGMISPSALNTGTTSTGWRLSAIKNGRKPRSRSSINSPKAIFAFSMFQIVAPPMTGSPSALLFEAFHRLALHCGA